MSARALCSHHQARNVSESATQHWDFTSRTDLTLVGVEFLVTNDRGDPCDLEHAWADGGLLSEGASDGINHGAACTAFEGTGGVHNGWCATKPAYCLTILNQTTGAIDGQAHVSAVGNGEFWLTWDQRLPVGKEYTVAAMAFFGGLRYGVRVTDGDVSGLPFIPRHLHVFGAYDGTYGSQNFGYFTDGYASRGSSITQGGRGLTWNTNFPPIIKQYLADGHAYVDPAPGGGMDGLVCVSEFTPSGWVYGGYGLQQHVVSAMGNVGPVALQGGVVHWENGTCAQESPYGVSGATGTPLFARSTFGHLDTPNAICSDSRADSYGVGIMGDDGIGYVASLRMDHGSRAASSRMVRRLCSVERADGNPISLDFAGFADGGMSYGVAEDAPAGWQVTQFVALGSSPSN